MSKDNVFYKMSKADYDALKSKLAEIQGILERAVVIDEPVVEKCEDKKPARAQLVMTVKPDNDENMWPGKQILGPDWANVAYYSYDTGRWLKEEYNGHRIGESASDMQSAKKVIEAEKQFCNMTIAGIAFMSVSMKRFSGSGQIVEKPRYDRNGFGAVGTVVFRDKDSGQLVSVPNQWVVIDKYNAGYSLSWWAGIRLASFISCGSVNILNAIKQIYSKER